MQGEFYAKAEAILSVTGSEKTQSVRVHFRDASNQLYAVDFPEPILGNLVTLLVATASKLKPSGKGQMMDVTSGRVFHLDNGNVGLELTLGGTLPVPLTFQKKGIEDLRSALRELVRRGAGEPDPMTH